MNIDTTLTTLPEWKALETHFDVVQSTTLRELFAADPARATTFSASVEDYYVDFSKHKITSETLTLLLALAEVRHVPEAIEAMFTGEKINTTEQRAVLHTALRSSKKSPLLVDGINIRTDILEVFKQMKSFARYIRDGSYAGCTGKKIKHVVNIGIGGSDLGPLMAYEALKPYTDRTMSFHFVSNIDATHLSEVLAQCNPEATLIIIASKTFITAETMLNAQSAKQWLLASLSNTDAVEKHMVALSTNTAAVTAFGISETRMFPFWDWVGGRYSLPSAIGLSLMIAIGPDAYNQFLRGYECVDDHFRSTPLSKNIPVLLGLLDVWYADFFKTPGLAILPYEQYLHCFPAYLQQLIMESNGKSVTKEGLQVQIPTAGIIFGEPGTNVEHSFFQMLHQGTSMIPVDFIAYKQSQYDPTHHMSLLSHCFVQASALAFGKTEAELEHDGVHPAVIPQRVMPGNRPSTIILGNALTPSTLGQLIALYEHRTFVSGVIWGINSFDQFGVELGKVLSKKLESLLTKKEIPVDFDQSTQALVKEVLSK